MRFFFILIQKSRRLTNNSVELNVPKSLHCSQWNLKGLLRFLNQIHRLVVKIVESSCFTDIEPGAASSWFGEPLIARKYLKQKFDDLHILMGVLKLLKGDSFDTGFTGKSSSEKVDYLLATIKLFDSSLLIKLDWPGWKSDRTW